MLIFADNIHSISYVVERLRYLHLTDEDSAFINEMVNMIEVDVPLSQSDKQRLSDLWSKFNGQK